MNRRVIACILCPNGCELEVTWNGEPTEQSLEVVGNLCPKGTAYALDELTHPERTLTTSIRIRGGVQRLASVKTASPIAREAIVAARQALRPMVLDAPVAIGQVVVEDVAATGVAVVVTRAVARRSGPERPEPPSHGGERTSAG